MFWGESLQVIWWFFAGIYEGCLRGEPMGRRRGLAGVFAPDGLGAAVGIIRFTDFELAEEVSNRIRYFFIGEKSFGVLELEGFCEGIKKTGLK